MYRTGTPQETLNQYISELQNNSNDNILREKIIKLVHTMKPAPVIPEEARHHFVMATALQKKASGDDGYKLAVEEYRQALLIAPWWPEAYYNLGVVLESSKSYDAAIDALKLYLATKPKEADAREAQDKIYIIEAAAKLVQAEARTKDEEKSRKEAVYEQFKGKWYNLISTCTVRYKYDDCPSLIDPKYFDKACMRKPIVATVTPEGVIFGDKSAVINGRVLLISATPSGEFKTREGYDVTFEKNGLQLVITYTFGQEFGRTQQRPLVFYRRELCPAWDKQAELGPSYE